MPAAWTLSPELHLCIISELSDDARSLKACSLVSRSWYHMAIHTFWSHRPLWVRVARTTDPERAKRLQNLLEGEPCHFTAHLRAVRLYGLDIRSFAPRQQATAYNTVSRIVELLLRASPDLKCLAISYLQFDQLSDGARQGLSSLKDLPSLELLRTSFPSTDALIIWISNFRKLQKLILKTSGPKVPESGLKHAENVERIDLQSLEELDFDMQPGPDIIIQQILTKPTCRLHSLTISWPRPFGFGLVAQLLDHVGSGLKSLVLDIGDAVLTAMENDMDDFSVSLNRNVGLTYLEVGTICIEEDEPYPCDWLRRFLQSINSPSIQQICIQFSPGRTDEEDVQEYFFDNFDWSTLDEILPSNRHFDAWKQVEIYVGGADYHLNNEEKVEGEFRSHLPNLEASTKLFFT